MPRHPRGSTSRRGDTWPGPEDSSPSNPAMIAPGLPRLARNVASILSSDVVNRGTTFLVYALVARHLGADQFGQMSLALALFYTFQVLAAAGLRTLLVREIAKDRSATSRYLIAGSGLSIVGSSASIVALHVFVRVMAYTEDTSSIILLLSFGLLPYALSSVIEAIFQAWERMHYIALANVPINIAKVVLVWLALQYEYGVYQVIVIFMFSYLLLIVIEWWLMRRLIARPALRPDWPFALALARSTSTFLGIDVLIAILASTNILLLSKLSTVTEVGLYSASIQLLVPAMLMFQSIVLSVFPVMCRRMAASAASSKWIAEQTIGLVVAVVLPVVIGLSFLADPVLLLMYGKRDFLPAAGLLQLAAWSLIPAAVTSGLGCVLMAAHRERLTLGLVAAHAVGNLVLGLFLVGQFGAMGAVMVMLTDKILGLCEHYVLVSRIVGLISVSRAVWRPAAASVCLAAYLAVAASEGLVLAAATGGLVYATVLLVLTVWSLGGPARFTMRNLHRWVEFHR